MENISSESVSANPLPKGYIPQDKRKKILLLCDDLRMHSGIATMAREFVLGTSHVFNWAQIAGSVQHPDKGKIFNLDSATNEHAGITDGYTRLYPVDGYGNPDILKQIMSMEKPDAILHFTDPRFWGWLYQIEREIRQICPIGYYSIWDDVPYPMYNRAFYESCDWIGCISKQTKNIVENVLGSNLNKPTTVTYVPHGININTFKPLTSVEDLKKLAELKKQLFKKDYNYVIFYNNRNIRRKQTSTIMLAYRNFCENLTKEEASKVVLFMHTNAVDENGTDLLACKEAFCPDNDVVFSEAKIMPDVLNQYYNIADVTINLSDNEGFGLGTAESVAAGTPIIVTVTGGLQDQCGFTDENGKPVEFDSGWGSNHDGRYKNHGKWVTPVYPGARMVQGSIPTPYILADYARWEDAAEAMMYWYAIGGEKREECGLIGREWLSNEGNLNSGYMCDTMASGLTNMISNWKGREAFNIHRHDEFVGHKMPNKQLGFILPKIDRDKVIKKFN
jgi:glycosyltransferase involved in cell wall biosynthesis